MSAGLETRADCSRCAALCCIAYPSQDMPGFAAVKDAGEPCPNLAGDGLCTIYKDREEKGFAGCIRYECFGAGQHVVQHLFGGRDWRDDPALLPQIVQTFLLMRPISDLAYLVQTALDRPDAGEHRAELSTLCAELSAIATSRDGLEDSARIARAKDAVKRIYTSIGRQEVAEP